MQKPAKKSRGNDRAPLIYTARALSRSISKTICPDCMIVGVAKIGIMQGRLVPPEGGRFQSFPRAQWRSEFSHAAKVPVDYIE